MTSAESLTYWNNYTIVRVTQVVFGAGTRQTIVHADPRRLFFEFKYTLGGLSFNLYYVDSDSNSFVNYLSPGGNTDPINFKVDRDFKLAQIQYDIDPLGSTPVVYVTEVLYTGS